MMPVPEKNQDCMNRAEIPFLAVVKVSPVPRKNRGCMHLPPRSYLVVSLLEGEVMTKPFPDRDQYYR